MTRQSTSARAISPLEHSLARGDPVAIELLLEQYGDAAITGLRIEFRRRLSPEERRQCLCDGIAWVFQRMGRYDPTRSGAETYLKHATRTAARAYLRNRDRSFERLRPDLEELADAAPEVGPSNPLEREERAAKLWKAVAKLPRDQKQACMAYAVWGQRDYARVLAEELGVTREVIVQRFARAKTALREALGMDQDFAEYTSGDTGDATPGAGQSANALARSRCDAAVALRVERG